MTTALLIWLSTLCGLTAIYVGWKWYLARCEETRVLREADLYARLRLGEIDPAKHCPSMSTNQSRYFDRGRQ